MEGVGDQDFLLKIGANPFKGLPVEGVIRTDLYLVMHGF